MLDVNVMKEALDNSALSKDAEVVHDKIGDFISFFNQNKDDRPVLKKKILELEAEIIGFSESCESEGIGPFYISEGNIGKDLYNFFLKNLERKD